MKNLIENKSFYYLKKEINYLFKKKKVKGDSISASLSLLKFVNILYIYIYIYDVNNLFFRYSILRNFWFFFLSIYRMFFYNIHIKINIKVLFILYVVKNIIINLLYIKKMNLLLNTLNWYDFTIIDNINFFFLLKLIKKKKGFINLFTFVIKNKVKKKVLKAPFFFFNKYKKKLFIVLINFYNNILNLKIRHMKAFILYWIRFYKYILKRFFIKIESYIKKIVNIICKQFNIFLLLIKGKTRKRFFNKSSFGLYFNIIRKWLNISFYKKENYFLFLFNYSFNNIKISNVLYKFKKSLVLFKVFIKLKFLFFFKNFIFIFFLQFILFWFNYYCAIRFRVITNKFCFNSLINYDLVLNFFYRNLVFISKFIDLNNILLLKYIYFFYMNIIK